MGAQWAPDITFPAAERETERKAERKRESERGREATELRRAPAHVRRAPVATGTKVQPRVRARGSRAEGGWTGGQTDPRVYARAYMRAYACTPAWREREGRTGEEPYLRSRGERLEVIHRRETRERNIACELRDWPSAGQRAGRGGQFVKTRGFQDDSGGNRSRSPRWSPRSRFANRV